MGPTKLKDFYLKTKAELSIVYKNSEAQDENGHLQFANSKLRLILWAKTVKSYHFQKFLAERLRFKCPFFILYLFRGPSPNKLTEKNWKLRLKLNYIEIFLATLRKSQKRRSTLNAHNSATIALFATRFKAKEPP